MCVKKHGERGRKSRAELKKKLNSVGERKKIGRILNNKNEKQKNGKRKEEVKEKEKEKEKNRKETKKDKKKEIPKK